MTSEKDDILKIKNFSRELRKNILKMAYVAGASSSHFGGALSIVEIVSILFSHKMKINNDPNWDDRDRFILSKGHACLAYYAALAEVGYISKEELETFEKDNSNLLGHPVINKKLGYSKEEAKGFTQVFFNSIINNVFREKKIPFRSFVVKKRDEKTLGELFCFFILETIMIGKALKINPFNQPEVELIKKETYKILKS